MENMWRWRGGPRTAPRNPQPKPKDQPILRPISIFLTGSFTPGGGERIKRSDKLAGALKSNAGGNDQSPEPLKSTGPPVNRAAAKLTLPPETCVLRHRTYSSPSQAKLDIDVNLDNGSTYSKQVAQQAGELATLRGNGSEPRTVSHAVFDHTSIIKTILSRFCPKALNQPRQAREKATDKLRRDGTRRTRHDGRARPSETGSASAPVLHGAFTGSTSFLHIREIGCGNCRAIEGGVMRRLSYLFILPAWTETSSVRRPDDELCRLRSSAGGNHVPA
jgi:hypothetical protein